MARTKLCASLLISLVVLMAQLTPALAAPARVDPTPTPTTAPTATPATPIVGTVQSITLQTDSTGAIIVVVTVTDSSGATQTLDLSVASATTLGLVTTDSSGAPVVNTSQIGQSITVDPSLVLPAAPAVPENPVGAAIAAFFGLDDQTIEGYHESGVGYGVIAQACWLSFALGGDASQCGAIIQAKQSGDYSAFTLPDGTVATNWGQFRKALLDKHNPLQTLGAIMSGRAHNDGTASGQTTGTSTTDTNTSGDTNGNGQGNGNGGNGNNGQGNGNGHGGNGQGNGHGHGHGKP